MIGACQFDSAFEIDTYQQDSYNYELYDFIVVPRSCDHGDTMSHAVIGDVRFNISTHCKLAETGDTLKTQQWRPRKSKECCRKRNKLRLPFTKIRSVLKLPKLSFSRHFGEKTDSKKALTTSNVKSGVEEFGQTGISVQEITPSEVLDCQTKNGRQETDPQDGGLTCKAKTAENPVWFKHLESPSAHWNFEYEDSVLVRTMSVDMSSEPRGGVCDLETLVVNYETSQTSTESQKPQQTKLAADGNAGDGGKAKISSSNDSMYECAFEFAKSHGYGFVKFVEEFNEEIVDEESAKRSRWRREQHRRGFQRRQKMRRALGGQDKCENPVHIYVPAYASHLKLGKTTGRGLCGGRPRDPQAFWTNINPGSVTESVSKDIEDIRQISKDIREALSAEMWLNTSPDSRAQLRRSFKRESSKSANSVSQSTSVPASDGATPHSLTHSSTTSPPMGDTLRPRSASNTARKSGLVLSKPVESSPKRSHSENERKSPTRSRASPRRQGAVVSGKSSAKNLNTSETKTPKSEKVRSARQKGGTERRWLHSREYKSPSEAEGRVDEDALDDNPALQYRELVKEMCEMIGSGFFQVWPGADNGNLCKSKTAKPGGYEEKRDTPRKEKGLVSKQQRCPDMQLIFKEAVDCHSEGQEDKANSNSVCKSIGNVDTEATRKDEKQQSTASWLPNVAHRNTSKHYRLCNSLSATIFRESQLSQVSFSEVGTPRRTALGTTPLEIVHVKDTHEKARVYKAASTDDSTLPADSANETPTLPTVAICDGDIGETCEFIGSEDNTKENVECLDYKRCPDMCSSGCQDRSSRLTAQHLSPSSSIRCVRNKRSNKALSPKNSQAAMSSSGHLVTKSGSRAGSCPNLAAHTSRLHRIMPNRAYTLRKSTSPKPRRARITTGSRLLEGDQTSSSREFSASVIGDHNIVDFAFFLEASDKCLDTIQDNPTKCCRRESGYQTETPFYDLPSGSIRDSAHGLPPDLARIYSPRRKGAILSKNGSSPETKLASESVRIAKSPDGDVCSINTQNTLSTNNNKADEKHGLECEEIQTSEDFEFSNSANGSSSMPFENKDHNNNGRFGGNDCENVSDDNVLLSHESSKSNLPELLKMRTFRNSKASAPSSSSSYNNNALTAPRCCKPNALPNVSSHNVRRKWSPPVESPEYKECHNSHGDFSPPDTKPIKLPAVFTSRGCDTNAETNSDKEAPLKLSTPRCKPLIGQRNSFTRHESRPVGLGAASPDDGDDDDPHSGFEIWATQNSHTLPTVTFPPASKAQSHNQPQLRRNSFGSDNKRQSKYGHATYQEKHGTLRNHPLNRSYVISRDVDEDHQTGEIEVPTLSTSERKLRYMPCQANKTVNSSFSCNEKYSSCSAASSAGHLELSTSKHFLGDRKNLFLPRPSISVKSPEAVKGRAHGTGGSRVEASLAALPNHCSKPFHESCDHCEESSNSNNNALWQGKVGVRMITDGAAVHKENKLHFICPPTPLVCGKSQSDSRIVADGHIPEPKKGLRDESLAKVVTNIFIESKPMKKNISNNAFGCARNNESCKNNGCLAKFQSCLTPTIQEQDGATFIQNHGHDSANTPRRFSYSTQGFVQSNRTNSDQIFVQGLMSTPRKRAFKHNYKPINNIYANINNGSSMNMSRGREREYSRRRRIHSESPISISLGGGSSSLSGSQAMQEVRDNTMEQSEAHEQTFSSPQLQSAPPTSPCLPRPGTSSDLWGTMLSQDPAKRRLWSCSNQQDYQQQQRPRQSTYPFQEQRDMLDTRFNNNIPYSPTTENYWQLALNPNLPLPSLQAFETTTGNNGHIPGSRSSPGFRTHINEGFSYEASCGSPGNNMTESMEITERWNGKEDGSSPDGHLSPAISPRDTTDQERQGTEDRYNLANLYRQLDSLWARSQNHVSERLENITNLVDARFKQMKKLFEKHILLVSSSSQSNQNNDTDTPSKKDIDEKNSYVSIQLNSEGTRNRILSRSSVSPDSSKYKRKNGQPGQHKSSVGKAEDSHQGTKGSLSCLTFPTINFAEFKAESNDDLSSTLYRPRAVRGSKMRCRSPTCKSKRMRQTRYEKSSPGSLPCASHPGTRCGCSQTHSRSCRRRRGMGAASSCNMCLPSRPLAKQLRRRMPAKRLVGAKEKKTLGKLIKRKPYKKTRQVRDPLLVRTVTRFKPVGVKLLRGRSRQRNITRNTRRILSQAKRSANKRRNLKNVKSKTKKIKQGSKRRNPGKRDEPVNRKAKRCKASGSRKDTRYVGNVARCNPRNRLMTKNKKRSPKLNSRISMGRFQRVRFTSPLPRARSLHSKEGQRLRCTKYKAITCKSNNCFGELARNGAKSDLADSLDVPISFRGSCHVNCKRKNISVHKRKSYKNKDNNNKVITKFNVARMGNSFKRSTKGCRQKISHQQMVNIGKIDQLKGKLLTKTKTNFKSVNRGVRFRITETGYSSLIRKFRSKYESLCSASLRCSAVGPCALKFVTRDRADHLVDRRRVIAPGGSSSRSQATARQKCSLNSAQEGQVLYGGHPDLNRYELDKAQRVRGATCVPYCGSGGKIFTEGNNCSLHCNCRWSQEPFSRENCEPKLAFRTHGSPPKAHAPVVEPGDLSGTNEPGAYFFKSTSRPTCFKAGTNLEGNMKTSVKTLIPSNAFRLRQVDSLELNRRRLSKRVNKISNEQLKNTNAGMLSNENTCDIGIPIDQICKPFCLTKTPRSAMWQNVQPWPSASTEQLEDGRDSLPHLRDHENENSSNVCQHCACHTTQFTRVDQSHGEKNNWLNQPVTRTDSSAHCGAKQYSSSSSYSTPSLENPWAVISESCEGQDTTLPGPFSSTMREHFFQPLLSNCTRDTAVENDKLNHNVFTGPDVHQDILTSSSKSFWKGNVQGKEVYDPCFAYSANTREGKSIKSGETVNHDLGAALVTCDSSRGAHSEGNLEMRTGGFKFEMYDSSEIGQPSLQNIANQSSLSVNDAEAVDISKIRCEIKSSIDSRFQSADSPECKLHATAGTNESNDGLGGKQKATDWDKTMLSFPSEEVDHFCDSTQSKRSCNALVGRHPTLVLKYRPTLETNSDQKNNCVDGDDAKNVKSALFLNSTNDEKRDVTLDLDTDSVELTRTNDVAFPPETKELFQSQPIEMLSDQGEIQPSGFENLKATAGEHSFSTSVLKEDKNCVSEHPYLIVKSQGISTTWISVAPNKSCEDLSTVACNDSANCRVFHGCTQTSRTEAANTHHQQVSNCASFELVRSSDNASSFSSSDAEPKKTLSVEFTTSSKQNLPLLHTSKEPLSLELSRSFQGSLFPNHTLSKSNICSDEALLERSSRNVSLKNNDQENVALLTSHATDARSSVEAASGSILSVSLQNATMPTPVVRSSFLTYRERRTGECEIDDSSLVLSKSSTENNDYLES